MKLWLSVEAGFAVGGQASAALIDGGVDLLEFLNATNERAANESCHVHA
jgi:hypothetical protein